MSERSQKGITVMSTAMTNCPVAGVSRTRPDARAATEDAVGGVGCFPMPRIRELPDGAHGWLG
jgi:hypothetical protein